MEERGKKPTMCSVLFMDIVEYSRKAVSGQIALKTGFNAILSKAIRDVPANDRIILDTGDGAVICFLGDADHALKVALLMCDGLLSATAYTDPPLQVRLGINYGPVRLIKNIDGQPNIVGDGINVAQRMKGFASPGQILSSRSYFDAVSRFSQKYAGMFHHVGSRTDKHVREHEIFAVSQPGALGVSLQDLVHGDKPKEAGKADALRHLSWQQRAPYVVALVLAIALFKFADREVEPILGEQAPPMADGQAQQAVSQTAAVDAVVPPSMVEPFAVEKPGAPQRLDNATQAALPAPESPGNISTMQKQLSGRPEVSKESGLHAAPSTPPREPAATVQGAMGRVSIAVMPWGEVYLDGRMSGISPPLIELKMAPGKHEIEIRNTTFPAYTRSIEIKAGERIRIKHKFPN